MVPPLRRFTSIARCRQPAPSRTERKSTARRPSTPLSRRAPATLRPAACTSRRYASSAGNRHPRKTYPDGPPSTWSWVETASTQPSGSTRYWADGERFSAPSTNASTTAPMDRSFAR